MKTQKKSNDKAWREIITPMDRHCRKQECQRAFAKKLNRLLEEDLFDTTTPDQLVQDISLNCFLSRRYENTYSYTLKTMLREGLGVAWLPESIVQLDFASGKLWRAGDNHWDIEFDVKLFHHHSNESSTKIPVLETSLEMTQVFIQ